MSGRTLDVTTDSSTSHFTSQGHGKIVVAEFIYIIGLRVPRLASTVNHIVKLFAVGPVEDTRKVL
jgi:hypothetical protein